MTSLPGFSQNPPLSADDLELRDLLRRQGRIPVDGVLVEVEIEYDTWEGGKGHPEENEVSWCPGTDPFQPVEGEMALPDIYRIDGTIPKFYPDGYHELYPQLCNSKDEEFSAVIKRMDQERLERQRLERVMEQDLDEQQQADREREKSAGRDDNMASHTQTDSLHFKRKHPEGDESFEHAAANNKRLRYDHASDITNLDKNISSSSSDEPLVSIESEGRDKLSANTDTTPPGSSAESPIDLVDSSDDEEDVPAAFAPPSAVIEHPAAHVADPSIKTPSLPDYESEAELEPFPEVDHNHDSSSLPDYESSPEPASHASHEDEPMPAENKGGFGNLGRESYPVEQRQSSADGYMGKSRHRGATIFRSKNRRQQNSFDNERRGMHKETRYHLPAGHIRSPSRTLRGSRPEHRPFYNKNYNNRSHELGPRYEHHGSYQSRGRNARRTYSPQHQRAEPDLESGFASSGRTWDAGDNQSAGLVGRHEERHENERIDRFAYDAEMYERGSYGQDFSAQEKSDRDRYDRVKYRERDYSERYDEEGHDQEGYDREGYDEDGYDGEGYDRCGFDPEGYDRNGYYQNESSDEEYNQGSVNDRDGYNREEYNHAGWEQHQFEEREQEARQTPTGGNKHFGTPPYYPERSSRDESYGHTMRDGRIPTGQSHYNSRDYHNRYSPQRREQVRRYSARSQEFRGRSRSPRNSARNQGPRHI